MLVLVHGKYIDSLKIIVSSLSQQKKVFVRPHFFVNEAMSLLGIPMTFIELPLSDNITKNNGI